ncbi:MAG: MgtC/SapB family protein [Candidatus Omnitrophota bacterium]
MILFFDDIVYHITVRIMLAALLSGLIGYEREIHGRAAGLRTTILVGVGSCLIMITSIHMHEMFGATANVDPGRIAAQVVSGIGFLGAGTILRFRASIRGLTTAAGLWAVAGIGLAVGCGFYSAALISTAVIYIVLVTLSRFEHRIKKKFEKTLKIDTIGGIDQLAKITKVLSSCQIEIKDIEIIDALQEGKFSTNMQLLICDEGSSSQLTESLANIKGITAIKWG